jgi:poly(hydroxyalkanoate) granule-associated protein
VPEKNAKENKMAKRLKKAAATPRSSDVLADQVKDSAQKIWLAGLGAFAKAKEEGGKVFEALVKQGQALDKKTRAVAEQAVETAKAQASGTIGKASGTFDKLDQVFQDRVHRSLNKLGVLTSRDIDDLTKQVSELSESVRSLVASEKRGAKGGSKAGGSKAGAAKRKPAAKSTVAKVTAAAKKTAKSAAKRGMKQAAKAVKTVKAKLA